MPAVSVPRDAIFSDVVSRAEIREQGVRYTKTLVDAGVLETRTLGASGFS